MTTQIASKKFETMIKSLVPMIEYAQIEVVELNDEEAIVKIPLIQENKNHLNSMYFGALSVGADVSGGILALYFAKKAGKHVAIVFKDFKADFLKRANDDVLFVCREGRAVEQLIQQAIESGERQNLPVHIEAISDSTEEVVAKFVLTLSVKLAS
ncbi:MAG: hypothetical protein A3F17_03940 [Gammaproteobacteria bacterium RIFCSPHIGHO2_12_FULL_41_15]|nr:MAG: hypothetical protein A3F17_03940 [Gammaproteobacteria bacterium RIFCSPHIGHO2_12_FULL_41_15]